MQKCCAQETGSDREVVEDMWHVERVPGGKEGRSRRESR